jgi:L-fuculose-phosphate aldolase
MIMCSPDRLESIDTDGHTGVRQFCAPREDGGMELVEVCHRLAASGLVPGTSGNVSVRDGDTIRLTPKASSLGAVREDDLATVNLDGTVLAGVPTSELELHLAIYRSTDAGAVVHTHSPKATAVACVADELPLVHYHLLTLGGAVRVAPFHAFGTAELAAAVIEALEGRTAALLANHGAVTYGATAADALDAAIVLEWACGVYLDASRLGTPRLLTEAQQRAVRESAQRHGYTSLGDH